MQLIASLEDLTELLADCYDDADLFNSAVLARPDYWQVPGIEGQREWCDAISSHHTVAIETGNALGKDYFVGGIIPWWLWTREDSLVIVTGPSQTLLGSVTWKEVRRAVEGCPFYPRYLSAKITNGVKSSPQVMEVAPGWQALGFSTTSIERLSGQHAGELLVILEEASGIEDHVWEAIDGLKAKKIVAIGNPIRAEGGFVRLCDQGIADAKNGIPKQFAVKYINVPSTASPDAGKDESKYGLADKGWLDRMARQYGKDSLWYRAHVLAIRPKLAHERLIQPEHLDACTSEATRERCNEWRQLGKAGKRRISCDVGEGVGNARSVIVVRDDLGILDITASIYQTPSDTAVAIAGLAGKWKVSPDNISYDGAGQTGKRLGNALSGQGYPMARPYFGSGSGGKRCTNLRTASAIAFARRIDPETYVGHDETHLPFHIPMSEHWPSIREELLELKYELKGDKSALEPKDDLMERLQRSPDFADAITQAFRDEAIRG